MIEWKRAAEREKNSSERKKKQKQKIKWKKLEQENKQLRLQSNKVCLRCHKKLDWILYYFGNRKQNQTDWKKKMEYRHWMVKKKLKKLSIASHPPSYRIMHCALNVIYLSVSMMMIMTTIASHALVDFESDGSLFCSQCGYAILSHTFTSYDCAVEHFRTLYAYELSLCTLYSILLATKRSDESEKKKKLKTK